MTSLNLAAATGIYWTAEAATIPYYEIGAPLRMPLSWWFATPTRQILHAGAVGTSEGGVLLAGKGGSGKSTAALSCLDSSLQYASEDYLLVALEAREVVGHSLFNTAKVKTNEDLARFPNLTAWVNNADKVTADNEKLLMFVDAHQPEKITHALPLKAIVFPRYIGDEKARYIPLAPPSAFKAMASSNVTQTPHLDKQSMQMMAQLTHRLPAYLLGFGKDHRVIPDLIAGILAENS